VLLVAGLVLIARGYYDQVYDDQTSIQTASRGSFTAAPRDNAHLATGDSPAPQALNSRAD
jgi:hypothetical protein